MVQSSVDLNEIEGYDPTFDIQIMDESDNEFEVEGTYIIDPERKRVENVNEPE
jgi:hypothetical protein